MAEKAKSKSNQSKSSKSSKAAQSKPSAAQRFIAYLKNVRQEIKRTSWPNRAEVLKMSALVIGALVFFGLTIFSLDSIMTRFVAFYAKLSPSSSGVDSSSIQELLNQVLSGLIY
ncbi:MAG: preprotein translocase subunit SecE [Coriobacteriia bacterium]|nr:preprotein translocase subunit SecE [Coriobacteriia bacterium]